MPSRKYRRIQFQDCELEHMEDFVVNVDSLVDKTSNLKPSAYNSLKFDQYVKSHIRTDTTISLTADTDDEFEEKVQKYDEALAHENRKTKYLTFSELRIASDSSNPASPESIESSSSHIGHQFSEFSVPFLAFEIPEFQPDATIRKQKRKDIKKYPIESKASLLQIEAAFKEFEMILANRKRECLKWASNVLKSIQKHQRNTSTKNKNKNTKNRKNRVSIKNNTNDKTIENDTVTTNGNSDSSSNNNSSDSEDNYKTDGDDADTGVVDDDDRGVGEQRVESIEIPQRMLAIDFENTKKMLNQIGTQLGEKEYELKNEQLLCVDKLREFVYFDDYSNNVSNNLNNLKLEYEKETLHLENEKENVKNEINNVMLILNQANDSILKIPRSTFNEFKALRQPASIICDVIKAVAIFSGQLNDYIVKRQGKWIFDESKELKSWRNVKQRLLSNSKFINDVIKFRFDAKNSINVRNRNIVQKKYLKRKEFTHKRINKANAVAGHFVLWLQSQLVCFLIFSFLFSFDDITLFGLVTIG